MQTVQQTVKILQGQFLVWLSTRCCAATGAVVQTVQNSVEILQLQFAVAVHRQDLHCLRGFCCILRHFSASVHLDVEAQGGGDAGSLTLRRSVTPIRCMLVQ